MVTTAKSSAGEAASSSASAPVLIDLGRKSRKKITKLRNGEGKLLADIDDAVAKMKADGTIVGDAQIVIAVVEQKPDLGSLTGFWKA